LPVADRTNAPWSLSIVGEAMKTTASPYLGVAASLGLPQLNSARSCLLNSSYIEDLGILMRVDVNPGRKGD
jgi:hypothetical protein